MTKKFVHTDKKINGKNSKSEFLIPDLFENQSRLIGIDSGRVYDFGLIVYTGKDLDEEELFNRISESSKIQLANKEVYKKILKNYLSQIKDIKVGKIVSLENNFILKEKTNGSFAA